MFLFRITDTTYFDFKRILFPGERYDHILHSLFYSKNDVAMISVFPIFKTTSLVLRQFTDSDIKNVFRGLSHPEVIKYYGVSYDTLEATKEQMIFFSNLEKTGTGIWWAIDSPDDKIFYGACGLSNLSKDHKKAEIGFWLLPEFWGQGILAEAIPLICQYGFQKLHLHRIEAMVETENKNCKSAMAKLGFQHEGTMMECEINYGKFISLDIYAMLNDENSHQ